MNRGYLYALLGLLAAGALFLSMPLWAKIPVGWIGGSSLYFATGYFLGFGELLLKNQRGRIPLGMKLLLLPILVGVIFYNWFARRVEADPPMQEVRPGLWLGRRLLPGDKPMLEENQITAILDEIRRTRTTAAPNTRQMRLLVRFRSSRPCQPGRRRARMIFNPMSATCRGGPSG